MRFSTLLRKPAEWMRTAGPHNDIVMTSRIRLARNLQGFAFPGWAKKEERLSLMQKVRPEIEEIAEMKEAFSEEMMDLSPIEKQVLVERHLISREHAAKGAGCATVMNRKQTVSIMINEEDHLRMQSIRPGLQLLAAHETLDRLDTELEERLPYAFDRRYGYLTACPTNLGTGMRASAMLHLPGLVLSDQINQTIQAANKIGLAVRGLYGEGTEALANLFQVSNQTTLGTSETQIIEHLDRVIHQMIENEENARFKLIEEKPVMLQDQIGRAFAILRYSHIIPSKEALNLLSLIRLGIDLEIFDSDEREVVNVLLTEIQPAHLQIEAKRKLNAEERDVLRADIIRRNLIRLTEPDFSGILENRENDDE
ncbi:MAG: protein arginine kinase [Verrucomicrobiae bacterium]|nr:protein arginine kinase [Verrucomicrobiae bacterium]MCP5539137.1 protein arginine kinase [Akkermansiaceae bacterium]MCP5549788.1 protein arginine kinase [Akkermansiaceae bacterium]